ncbi:MAG: hypothetical protein JSS83_07550 [Cyanobacteria bacterium SZAS LIN-3]|nr:hypothetical protein [Cyanobacteria bacterium SZAS LIN-3]
MSKMAQCNTKRLTGAIAASLLVCILAQGSAQAGPTNEVFSAMPQSNTKLVAPKAFTPAPANAVAAPGAMDLAGRGGSPETRWFEQLDAICFKGYPTPLEKSILSRTFNQEAERVQEWSAVAAAVSTRYRNTAKSLRNLPVPSNWTEMDQYREVRADWFDDAATIYEDMIRPRKPARTIEELNAQLAEISSRAEQLGETKKINREMDRKLRRAYHIHAPLETDALNGYITGQSHK